MMEFFQIVWPVIYLFALVSLFTYGMNCYLLIIYYRLKRPKSLQQHAEIKKNFYEHYSIKNWPRVTIQLPIFNERYVVARLIESVGRFDYPKELLEIQLLDDSTDDTADMARVLAELDPEFSRAKWLDHLGEDRPAGVPQSLQLPVRITGSVGRILR